MASSTSGYDLAASTSAGEMNITMCEASNDLVTMLLIPVKIIVVSMNVILFIAAARDWKKLHRQNYTFQCVMSTLGCNTLFLLMSIWLTVDNYPQTSSDPQKGRMTPEKALWVFSEAFTASLIVGISANVTSLTWVTLDSVFYVGRSGTEWGSTSAKEEPSQRRKVRWARFLVIASWVLPLLLMILAFGWNCAKECECPSNNFIGDHCPDESRCSNMWAPLKKDYLVLVMAFWMIEVVILLVFIYRGVRKHVRTTEAPSPAKEEDNMTPAVCSMTGNETTKEEEEIEMTQRRKSSVVKRKLSSKLNFSICLTALLIFTLLPATISSLIDICITDPPYYHTMTVVSTIFIFIYCACCPVLMWKFLPSLRSSTVTLCMALKNGRKGKTRKRPVDGTRSKD